MIGRQIRSFNRKHILKSVVAMSVTIMTVSTDANLIAEVLQSNGSSSTQAATATSLKKVLSLTSTGFSDGGVIPEKFTAPTPNQFQNSPPLVWSGTPEGTVSYVLLLHDLDAAMNHRSDDVTHWLIYNIPGTVTSLPEGVSPIPRLPDGSVQAPNVRKTPGYLGPGARGIYHHYTFELYALDTKLTLPVGASRTEVFDVMQGHILDKAVLVGKYMRKD